MKPFNTFAIVLASSMLLASCGGGSGQSLGQIMTASESDAGAPGQARMKALSVPGTWTGRVPSTPTIAPSIPSPQGQVAANILLLEIAPGKDAPALAFIAQKRWAIIERSDEVVKVGVQGANYEALRINKEDAEKSGLFSLVELAGYLSSKTFTRPDPSLSDGNTADYWNYNAIRARQAWNLVGAFDGRVISNVAVFDKGFSQNRLDDLTLANVYKSVGTSCDGASTLVLPNCNHGYHVTGIVGATGNDGQGHVGIASGYTNMASIRAANLWQDDHLIFALREELLTYNGSLKSTILNMSLGNDVQFGESSLSADRLEEVVEGARRSSRIIRSTIERRMAARGAAGLSNEILFVQSSGNEGRAQMPGGGYLPAEYSYLFASFLNYQTGSSYYQFVKERTLLVGAFDSDRSVWPHTSLPTTEALQSRFILAPGVRIFSNTRSGIDHKTGTSMAAPHVTAVAALISQVAGNLDSKTIADIILSTADNQAGRRWKPGDGYKFLNAERAVERAIQIKRGERVTLDDDFSTLDAARWHIIGTPFVSSSGTVKLNGGSLTSRALAYGSRIFIKTKVRADSQTLNGGRLMLSLADQNSREIGSLTFFEQNILGVRTALLQDQAGSWSIIDGNAPGNSSVAIIGPPANGSAVDYEVTLDGDTIRVLRRVESSGIETNTTWKLRRSVAGAELKLDYSSFDEIDFARVVSTAKYAGASNGAAYEIVRCFEAYGCLNYAGRIGGYVAGVRDRASSDWLINNVFGYNLGAAPIVIALADFNGFSWNWLPEWEAPSFTNWSDGAGGHIGEWQFAAVDLSVGNVGKWLSIPANTRGVSALVEFK